MAEIDVSELPRVAELFHRAALDGDWRSALDAASIILGAEGIALIGAPSSRVGANHSEGIDELVERFVNEKWFLLNPRIEAAARAGVGTTGVATEWLVFSEAERDRLPFNGDFINRLGFGHYAGIYLGDRGGNSIILSVERRRSQGAYGREDLEMMKRILPALQQATRVAVGVAEARDAGFADGLELLSGAAMLLDHAGRPVHANRMAEMLIRSGDICIAGSRLAARHPSANDQLQRSIGEALAFPSVLARAARVAIPRIGHRPLLADVAPLAGASDDLFRFAKVIVLVKDPDHVAVPDEVAIRLLFGLTQTEATIAVRIAAGLTIDRIAEDLGIGVGTVRIHLKAIFLKTHTHRQAELTSVLLQLGP